LGEIRLGEMGLGEMGQNHEDMATGKLQIRRFQRPHSGLTTPRQETPSNI